MKLNPAAVVAIGGNFLSDGTSSIEDQLSKARKAAALIRILVDRNLDVVVVHGNGPQVGMSYLQQLIGQKQGIPPKNLAMCNALTQAEIGTILELAIINTLNKENPNIDVLTLVSQVEVSGDDPAFHRPTKPIGPFYTKTQAGKLKKQYPDWTFIEDAGRGYRRVVPSPRPIKVFSTKGISETFKTANVIIAGGGGGIPVVRNKDKQTFALIDSVIDKDRTALLIAQEIKAAYFILLTSVPHVYINFGTESEKALHHLPVEDARKYLQDGQFPAGSMGPKIEAAIQFVETTGNAAIITNADNIEKALDKKAGTVIC